MSNKSPVNKSPVAEETTDVTSPKNKNSTRLENVIKKRGHDGWLEGETVMDVSDVNAEGGGFAMIDAPVKLSGNKKWVGDLRVVSDNFEHYKQTLETFFEKPRGVFTADEIKHYVDGYKKLYGKKTKKQELGEVEGQSAPFRVRAKSERASSRTKVDKVVTTKGNKETVIKTTIKRLQSPAPSNPVGTVFSLADLKSILVYGATVENKNITMIPVDVKTVNKVTRHVSPKSNKQVAPSSPK